MSEIHILDQNSTDLLLNPMVPMERAIATPTTPVTVYATVQGEDRLRAVLDWNDGSQPVAYPEQDSPLTVQATRNLGLGTYNIALTAFNTDSPTPAEVKIIFPWTISRIEEKAAPSRNIFGPILPRDVGLPNNQTWNYNLDADLRVLASNIKMLLITARGERVMAPTYGTNLKRIIFESNLTAVEGVIQQEIAQAVAQWEPRVLLQSLAVHRNPNKRLVTVEAVFLSRQSSKQFDVNLQFAAS